MGGEPIIYPSQVTKERSNDSWSTISEHKDSHQVSASDNKSTQLLHNGLGHDSGNMNQKSGVTTAGTSPSSSSGFSGPPQANPSSSIPERGHLSAPLSIDHAQAAGLFKGGPDNNFPPLSRRSSFRRIASWLTGNSNGSICTDDGSLADFHESEWTPPDSSYGAALPVFGCIPKNMRRMIELSIIGLMVVGLVVLVVTASIRVTEGYNDGNTSSSAGGLSLNDDYYVEYPTNNDDDLNAVDDDMFEYSYYGDEVNDDGNRRRLIRGR